LEHRHEKLSERAERKRVAASGRLEQAEATARQLETEHLESVEMSAAMTALLEQKDEVTTMMLVLLLGLLLALLLVLTPSFLSGAAAGQGGARRVGTTGGDQERPFLSMATK